jgi:hypothetical protein
MSLLEPPQELLTLLRESLPESAGETGDEAGSEDILAYVAFLAAGLCDAQEFSATTWSEALQPYLERLVSSSEEPVNKFREAAQTITMGEGDDESYGDHDDEGFEEVCDLRFKYVLYYELCCCCCCTRWSVHFSTLCDLISILSIVLRMEERSSCIKPRCVCCVAVGMPWWEETVSARQR